MTLEKLDHYKAGVGKAVTTLFPNMICALLGNYTKYLIGTGLYQLYSIYIDICMNILIAVINDMSINLKYTHVTLYSRYKNNKYTKEVNLY